VGGGVGVVERGFVVNASLSEEISDVLRVREVDAEIHVAGPASKA
jgi:hypothetical protein